MNIRSHSRKSFRAQSLVEFSLVAPLFFFLLFGVLEGGRLIYSYNTINHAAQEAARFGIVADTASVAAVRGKAVDAADPLALNSGDVDVQVNGGAKSYGDRTIGDRLSVTVDYGFTPLVFMVFGSSSPIQLTADTEMMIE